VLTTRFGTRLTPSAAQLAIGAVAFDDCTSGEDRMKKTVRKTAAGKRVAGEYRPEFLRAAELVIADLARNGTITADKKKGLLELIQLERESKTPKYGYTPNLAGFPDIVKKKCGPVLEKYAVEVIAGWLDEASGNWRLLLIDINDDLFCFSTHGSRLWRVSLSQSMDMFSRRDSYGQTVQRPSWVWHWQQMIERKLRWIEGLEARRPKVKWLKGGASCAG
jgi:hypothetical protein